MNNTRECWEEDQEWLENELQKINIKPSEAVIERFCERVAIGTSCANLTVTQARQQSLSELVK